MHSKEPAMRSNGAAAMIEGPSQVFPRSDDVKTRNSSRRLSSWSGPTVSRKVSSARTVKPHIRPEPVGAIGLLSQVRPPSAERKSRSWLKCPWAPRSPVLNPTAAQTSPSLVTPMQASARAVRPG